jgi:hypothetical protein
LREWSDCDRLDQKGAEPARKNRGRNIGAIAGVIDGMHSLKLGRAVAILAAAAGFSAVAGPAEAQISGTTGGDIVIKHPAPAFDDPFFFPTDGIVAAQLGRM